MFKKILFGSHMCKLMPLKAVQSIYNYLASLVCKIQHKPNLAHIYFDNPFIFSKKFQLQILQEEIEAKHHKSKTNGDASSSSMTSQSAYDDDLRMKIDENERLHKQLYDVELKNRTIEQVTNNYEAMVF